MKKVQTMKVSGGDYAKVKDRMLEFRQENPRGLIETTPTITDDSIIFKARILKDKADPNSAEAIGHSMGKGTGQKVFEKQETIAVGRALAFLGYGASGEIASSEEMEEFEDWKQEQFMEAMEAASDQITLCKTEDELKTVWTNLSPELKKSLETLKDNRKQEINENSKVRNKGAVATSTKG